MSVALENREQIIEQVAQGYRLTDIAQGLKVSPQAISHSLKNDPDYLTAREVGHASRLDRAEQGIMDAADSVDVARARTLWGAYSWRAEREMPQIWGAKQQVQVSGSVTLDMVLSTMNEPIPGLSTREQPEDVPILPKE